MPNRLYTYLFNTENLVWLVLWHINWCRLLKANIYIYIYMICKHILLITSELIFSFFPVCWGCKLHRLYLCRGVRLRPNQCPAYDTKKSDGGVQWCWSFGNVEHPFWPGVVALDWVLSVAQIELNCVLMLNRITQNSFWHWNCAHAKLNCSK